MTSLDISHLDLLLDYFVENSFSLSHFDVTLLDVTLINIDSLSALLEKQFELGAHSSGYKEK